MNHLSVKEPTGCSIEDAMVVSYKDVPLGAGFTLATPEGHFSGLKTGQQRALFFGTGNQYGLFWDDVKVWKARVDPMCLVKLCSTRIEMQHVTKIVY